MATRSFTEKLIIKDKKALERLNDALQKESYFKDVQPITDKECEKRAALAKEFMEKWSSSH